MVKFLKIWAHFLGTHSIQWYENMSGYSTALIKSKCFKKEWVTAFVTVSQCKIENMPFEVK